MMSYTIAGSLPKEMPPALMLGAGKVHLQGGDILIGNDLLGAPDILFFGETEKVDDNGDLPFLEKGEMLGEKPLYTGRSEGRYC